MPQGLRIWGGRRTPEGHHRRVTTGPLQAALAEARAPGHSLQEGRRPLTSMGRQNTPPAFAAGREVAADADDYIPYSSPESPEPTGAQEARYLGWMLSAFEDRDVLDAHQDPR